MGFHFETFTRLFQNLKFFEELKPNHQLTDGKEQTPCPPASTMGSLPLQEIEKKAVGLPEKFFKEYAPFAVLSQKMTGIPASVTLAQAALESGYGKHAPGFNFFGIKGEGPAGTQRLKTWEFRNGKKVRVRAGFRKYHNALESFLDHAKVISRGRYLKHAMNHTDSAESFIRALQSKKAKYATDPNYVPKILGLIRHHHLEKLDRSL